MQAAQNWRWDLLNFCWRLAVLTSPTFFSLSATTSGSPLGEVPPAHQQDCAISMAPIYAEWSRTFSAFTNRVSAPPTVDDCMFALDLQEHYFGAESELIDASVDPHVCMARAKFLTRVLRDLRPWLVPKTCQYVDAIASIAMLYSYGKDRDRAEVYLGICAKLCKRIEADPPKLLSVGEQRDFIIRASSIFHSTLRDHCMHWGRHQEALGLTAGLIRDLSDILARSDLQEKTREQADASIRQELIKFAGLLRLIAQSQKAQGEPFNNDVLRRQISFLDGWRAEMSNDFSYLHILAHLKNSVGDHSAALNLVLELKRLPTTKGGVRQATTAHLEGSVRAMLGDSEGAIAAFERCVESSGFGPEDPAKPLSLADIDTLGCLTAIYFHAGRTNDACRVEKRLAKEKARLRTHLLRYGTEEQRIRAAAQLNELNYATEMLTDEQVANTVLNAKNAVLTSTLFSSTRKAELVVADVQNSLRDGDVYLDLVEIDGLGFRPNMLLVLRVTHNAMSLRWIPLSGEFIGNSRLLMRAVRSAHAVGRLDREGLSVALSRIAELVLEAARLDLEDESMLQRRLLICPSVTTRDIPWWVLPVVDGNPLCMYRDVCIVSTPSRLSYGSTTINPTSALVLADPEAGSELGLPGARREAVAVSETLAKQAMGVKCLYGQDATFDALAANADILHLACHAVEEEEATKPYASPLLRLAGEEGACIVQVSPRQIAALRCKRYIAVLAACYSGTGPESKGEGRTFHEGRFGLTRAFAVSGAEYVVSSLWQVSDSYSPGFFRDFYGRLAEEGAIGAFNETLREKWAEATDKDIVLFACLYGGFAITR